MSSIIFDPTTLPELEQQKPQRPWRRRTPVFTGSVVAAVIIPLAIVTAMFLRTDIPGPVILVAIYLPLQMLASAVAAIATKGQRGILDSVIIVNAIGATIFSLVVLVSVIGSLIIRGSTW